MEWTQTFEHHCKYKDLHYGIFLKIIISLIHPVSALHFYRNNFKLLKIKTVRLIQRTNTNIFVFDRSIHIKKSITVFFQLVLKLVISTMLLFLLIF